MVEGRGVGVMDVIKAKTLKVFIIKVRVEFTPTAEVWRNVYDAERKLCTFGSPKEAQEFIDENLPGEKCEICPIEMKAAA
jgi:hypothetical protein